MKRRPCLELNSLDPGRSGDTEVDKGLCYFLFVMCAGKGSIVMTFRVLFCGQAVAEKIQKCQQVLLCKYIMLFIWVTDHRVLQDLQRLVRTACQCSR